MVNPNKFQLADRLKSALSSITAPVKSFVSDQVKRVENTPAISANPLTTVGNLVTKYAVNTVKNDYNSVAGKAVDSPEMLNLAQSYIMAGMTAPPKNIPNLVLSKAGKNNIVDLALKYVNAEDVGSFEKASQAIVNLGKNSLGKSVVKALKNDPKKILVELSSTYNILPVDDILNSAGKYQNIVDLASSIYTKGLSNNLSKLSSLPGLNRNLKY